CQQVYSYPCSF
nr:immunoglobulin light chain junction region [Macaca mulatta]MOV80486.1 immunoglobulin light chain junction region [Macaca mulatta]MOV85131.1 immunoglobulin light chain junction region [Macaca mulatta]